jgi:hypothetical protein
MKPGSAKLKPPLDSDAILRRLDRAARQHLLVTVRRWIPRSDRVEGFVCARGPEWVALAIVDDRLRPDGWSLLRLADIQSVAIEPDSDCLEVRALKANGEWPPATPELDVASTSSIIDSLASSQAAISLFSECRRPDVCWVGSPTLVDGRTVKLQELDLDARWSHKLRLLDLEDITRVEFGGGY